MNLLHLHDLRHEKNKQHAEFSSDLRLRFRAISLLHPRSIQEISTQLQLSVKAINSFMQGLQKTNYKSLCIIEAWIKSEEHRLGII